MIHLLAVAVLTFPHFDAHGDPLPPGATLRLGTVRDRIGDVASFDLSPDGKTLAAETANHLTLWDVESGRPTLRIPRVSKQYFDVRNRNRLIFTADGKQLIHLSDDRVRGYDATTGRQVFDKGLEASGLAVWRLPDSSHFAVVDGGPSVSTFDASARLISRAAFGEKRAYELFPMGERFLAIGYPNNALIDVKTGKALVSFEDHQQLEHFCVFAASPDGRRLYAMPQDGRLRTYDVATGKKVEELARPAGWTQYLADTRIAVSADGAILYAWKEGKPTQRRDLKAGKWLDPLPAIGTDNGLMMGDRFPLILPDGKRLLFVGRAGILQRYELATARPIAPPDGFRQHVVASGSPDGRFVVVTTFPTGTELYDLAGKRLWSVSSEGAWGADTAWSTDGRRLAFVSPGQIAVRDAATSKVVWSLAFKDVIPSPEERRVSSFSAPITFNAAGDRLAVAFDFSYGPGQPLALIDARLGKPVNVFRNCGHTGWALPAGARREIAQAYKTGFLFVDQATGADRFVELADPDLTKAENSHVVLYSPDGDYLLTTGGHDAAVLRDPRTGRPVRRIAVPRLHRDAVAFSGEGLWLATGSTDGSLAVWDVTTGERVWENRGHAEGVNRVSFLGRRRLVSSSADRTALVWDLRPAERPEKPAWEALSGTNGREAWRAVWAVAADPSGPELLRAKVAPLPAPSADRVKQLIAELGADRFPTREAATRSLAELGRVVEPELRAARAATKSEEVRTRLDGLLAKIAPERTAGEVAQARAVAAMELAGTPAAKTVLAEWAGGASTARLTIDAKAALERLGVR